MGSYLRCLYIYPGSSLWYVCTVEPICDVYVHCVLYALCTYVQYLGSSLVCIYLVSYLWRVCIWDPICCVCRTKILSMVYITYLGSCLLCVCTIYRFRSVLVLRIPFDVCVHLTSFLRCVCTWDLIC
jgi:hypothetical protein